MEEDDGEVKSWTQQDFGLDRRLIKVRIFNFFFSHLISCSVCMLGTFQTWIYKANAGAIQMHSYCFARKRSSGRTYQRRISKYFHTNIVLVKVRARTGSGKTIAFSLPVLQKILTIKNSLSNSPTATSASIKCLILVPTKELMKQIESQITHLIYYCREIISVGSLADDNSSGLSIEIVKLFILMLFE